MWNGSKGNKGHGGNLKGTAKEPVVNGFLVTGEEEDNIIIEEEMGEGIDWSEEVKQRERRKKRKNYPWSRLTWKNLDQRNGLYETPLEEIEKRCKPVPTLSYWGEREQQEQKKKEREGVKVQLLEQKGIA